MCIRGLAYFDLGLVVGVMGMSQRVTPQAAQSACPQYFAPTWNKKSASKLLRQGSNHFVDKFLPIGPQ